MIKHQLKMDDVDTQQQKEIDGLIFKLALISVILIIWCAALTGYVLRK